MASNTSKRRRLLGNFLLDFLVVQCLLMSISTSEEVNRPEIIYNGESVDALTVESGDTLKLICHGDKPLVWNHTETDFAGKVNVSESEGFSRRYTSTLEIANITSADGGFITCSYVGVSFENSDELAAGEDDILVHVRDENHLMKKIPPDDTAIIAVVRQTVYLPCVRNWPEVQIRIFHEDTSQPISLEGVQYENLKGYKIEYIDGAHAGSYICQASYNDKYEEQQFSILLHGDIEPPPSGTINPPTIRVFQSSSVAVGESFGINCSTVQDVRAYFSVHLAGPALATPDRVKSHEGGTGSDGRRNNKEWYKTLYVAHARKEDSGTYTCKVQPVNGVAKSRDIQISVFDIEDRYLEVSTASENITVQENGEARWIVNITSFPLNYDFLWLKPNGDEIKKGKLGRFMISETKNAENEYRLVIKDVKLEDMGYYPFKVLIPGSDVEPKTLNLSLIVKARPKVSIISKGHKTNFMFNKMHTLQCKVLGYPRPTFQWSFQECSTWSNCTDPENVPSGNIEEVKNGFISNIQFNATRHGKYLCLAENNLGNANDSRNIRVVDFEGDDAIRISTPSEIVEGDDPQIICAVTKLDHGKNISWVKVVNGEAIPLESDVGVISVELQEEKWSWRKILQIRDISRAESGSVYQCISHSEDNPVVSNVILRVLGISSPRFISTNLDNSKISLKLGDQLNLTCNIEGRPKPNIVWTWDGLDETQWPVDMKYSLASDASTMFLTYVPADAGGRFKCTATNRNGTTSAYVDIAVTGTRTFSNIAVIIILVLFAAVIASGIVVARFKYKQGRFKRFLKEINHKEFNEGAVDSINPDLGVADQAYLLPYNPNWEFPKDRLKFGKELGSGAFGRVVKAEAFGISPPEPVTTVAVKMVKPNADESHFKALMSELKIMVHLGKHINVVNLVGACTKNLAKKKELYVIVEYCKYGSLLSYMHRHKRSFINQLDPARGVIDSTIDRPTNNSGQSQTPQRISYAQLTFVDGGNSRKPASNGYRTLDDFSEPIIEDPPTPILQPIEVSNGFPPQSGFVTPNRRSTEHYVPESQVESVCTGVTYVSNGQATDGTTKRRSSDGSQWQDHYRGDYQFRDVSPIKTTDLLCWAFQISRGMEYLASRKVLHGDLACRNVLLHEDNVVKICDFGLAKEMYKDYKYKKKSESVPLPVKWMAIESIYYGLFSTQSDSWSFGVVLWELFTLGKTPYPGMEADDRFYKRISEGYRMEKPPLAPSCVYDIMLECWSQEPTERPSFSTLADRIGDMMEESLRNHYVDLNSGYMKINQSEFSNRPDYLLQMGRADFASNSERPTPERAYQNVPENPNAGYLVPITSPTSLNAPELPTAPQYQNIQQPTAEPQMSMLAHNSGYMFVKAPVSDTLHLGQKNETVNGNLTSGDNQASVTVEIRYSPDIKDMYGLRADSASPDAYSLSEANVDLASDSNLVNITVQPDGIRGIDNKNYVHHLPSHNSTSENDANENQTQTRQCNSSGESAKERRQKRQKNDSGLGSIDSNQFDNHSPKYKNQDKKSCGEFNMFQQSNGYVSHHNIATSS